MRRRDNDLWALPGGGMEMAGAIKLLRERTDIDLAGGYHLVTELSVRLDTR